MIGSSWPAALRVSRKLAAAGLLFIAVAALQCRRAEGVTKDPLDRLAQQTLVEYLRIDTTNPPGNETAGARFLRDFLVSNGVEAQLVGTDPARQAVYARLRSGVAGDALLLLSHIDVVAADGASWTHPPFSGREEGGYIWGRGALDIKSLTIAQAVSLIDLKKRGAKLRRDVILLAVPDEELGGTNGTAKLLETRPELFADVAWVLNEGGSNETAVDTVIAWGIEVQQKVPLWLRVRADGIGGHGATPPANGGAPARLVRALSKIDAIETPWRLEASVARAAATAARVRKDGRGRRLALLREPLDIARIRKELPGGYLTLLRDTIAITQITSGGGPNVIASRATADIDIRLLPDSDPDAMLKKVRDTVGSDVTVEVLLSSRVAPATPAEGPLFDSLSRVMRAAAPEAAVVPLVGAGTTDSRYFRARGIKAYGMSPFKVNYYDAESIHGPDERIRTRFFLEGVRLMRSIVRDFCVTR